VVLWVCVATQEEEEKAKGKRSTEKEASPQQAKLARPAGFQKTPSLQVRNSALPPLAVAHRY
jgi:hypothetical protein